MSSYSKNIVPSFDDSAWFCSAKHNARVSAEGFKSARYGWARCKVDLCTLFELDEGEVYSLPDKIKVICQTDFNLYLSIAYVNTDEDIASDDDENAAYTTAIYVPAGTFKRKIKIEPSNAKKVIITMQRVGPGTSTEGIVSKLKIYFKKDGTTDITQISGITGETGQQKISKAVAPQIKIPDTVVNKAIKASIKDPSNPINTAISTSITDVTNPINISTIEAATTDIADSTGSIVPALVEAGFVQGSNISMSLEGTTLYISFS